MRAPESMWNSNTWQELLLSIDGFLFASVFVPLCVLHYLCEHFWGLNGEVLTADWTKETPWYLIIAHSEETPFLWHAEVYLSHYKNLPLGPILSQIIHILPTRFFFSSVYQWYPSVYVCITQIIFQLKSCILFWFMECGLHNSSFLIFDLDNNG